MLVVPIEVTVEARQMFILESKHMERPKSEPWEPLMIQRQGNWSAKWSPRKQGVIGVKEGRFQKKS